GYGQGKRPCTCKGGCDIVRDQAIIQCGAGNNTQNSAEGENKKTDCCIEPDIKYHLRSPPKNLRHARGLNGRLSQSHNGRTYISNLSILSAPSAVTGRQRISPDREETALIILSHKREQMWECAPPILAGSCCAGATSATHRFLQRPVLPVVRQPARCRSRHRAMHGRPFRPILRLSTVFFVSTLAHRSFPPATSSC